MLDRAGAAPYKRRSPPGLAAGGDAQVAQLVEHATENRSVGGSIPPLGTNVSNDLAIPEAEQDAVRGHTGGTDELL